MCKKSYKKATLIALENDEACLQQNFVKENIGMICAIKKMTGCVEKALKNPKACVQQEKNGFNIGMHAITNGLLSLKDKITSNKDACKQVNFLGHTINFMIEETNEKGYTF